jgi:hypothetical protein
LSQIIHRIIPLPLTTVIFVLSSMPEKVI